MEKAIFVDIQQSKKGTLHGKIKFENGAIMPIPKGTKLSMSFNNKECEVTRVNGIICCIAMNGVEILSSYSVSALKKDVRKYSGSYSERKQSEKVNMHKDESSMHRRSTVNLRNLAKAPYNFVPLNQTVVKGQAPPCFDIYEEKRFTGHIVCLLKTLTPLYIRDTYTQDELVKKENGEDNSDFFSPGGHIRIPGSSLRGMIRNLVEILSWGKFGFFEDKLLFYRCFNKNDILKEEYLKKISYNRKTGRTTLRAGYLTRQGNDHFIIPAKVENAKQFIQEKKKDENKYKEFVIEKRPDGKYLVISGNMKNKKHDWLINPPDYGIKMPVLPIDIESYKKDSNRYEDKAKKHDGNLLRLLATSQEGIVPCFYVRWKDASGNERISFGHTGYFRLAYQYTIGEYIPGELTDTYVIDMTERLFGKSTKNESIASRVFFEDAKLIPGQNDIISQEPKIPQTLAEPKPTTFQHYLESSNGSPNHWNSKTYKRDVVIRGNKYYWHKENPDWEAKGQVSDKMSTEIRPVKANTKFEFIVRYENLTSEELGLLLSALDLPEGCYHKLGMGKPLGLGSVKLDPRLYIDNRQERYKKLFDDDKWFLAESQRDMKPFKVSFEEHILKQIGQEAAGASSFWDLDRMQQLRTMLSWGNTKTPEWTVKTGYMELSEFRNRSVIPKPDEVTKQ